MPRFLPLLIALALILPACASRHAGPTEPLDLVMVDDTTLRIPAGKYAAAFDAARHELREAGFALERVDAFSGIITTAPSGSAGFATPWSQDQSTVRQEFNDFFQRHYRTVRITFEPAEPLAASPLDPPTDLRSLDTELLMRTRVVLDRNYRPGWQIANTSIRHSSYYTDPDLQARGMQPGYSVARAEDRLLAERIARRIATAEVPVAAAGSPAP
jgi:hypothetical protein